MARRAFFSFHYSRDIWRANVVRNSWLTHPDRHVAGFWDASLWEETKLRGRSAVRNLIDQGLINTSVTVVLIGAETASREYVEYEITQSRQRGNGLLGIYIHNIANQTRQVDNPGVNPFSSLYEVINGTNIPYTSFYKTYYWHRDEGYKNIGTWIEDAARKAGR